MTYFISKHIDRVEELFNMAAAEELATRGKNHDASKFEPEELVPLQQLKEIVDREGPVEYQSEEYVKRSKILEPMLKHDYERNSHHSEHYENGVNGMNLFDIVEMFFDWKAASEKNDADAMVLTAAVKRFNIDSQLADIFKNTALKLGYKYK